MLHLDQITCISVMAPQVQMAFTPLTGKLHIVFFFLRKISRDLLLRSHVATGLVLKKGCLDSF